MITIKLTMEQATLVSTAIQAEIRKGEGTFLDYGDVEALTMVMDYIDLQVEQRLFAAELAG